MAGLFLEGWNFQQQGSFRANVVGYRIKDDSPLLYLKEGDEYWKTHLKSGYLLDMQMIFAWKPPIFEKCSCTEVLHAITHHAVVHSTIEINHNDAKMFDGVLTNYVCQYFDISYNGWERFSGVDASMFETLHQRYVRLLLRYHLMQSLQTA